MKATRWHNNLPGWIEADLAERPLRQGPRATLQAIANQCDGPKVGDTGAPLLVCFGGEKLIACCGCSKSTFWTHLRILRECGYVVELRRGGGKLASVYGIPGERGQLGPFRSAPDEKPRRWLKSDTETVRRLVSENRTLASKGDGGEQATGNRLAPLAKADGRGPGTGRQPSGNETLPSHPPSPEPTPLPSGPATRPNGRDDGLMGRLQQLRFGKPRERARLVRDHPEELGKALARLDRAVTDGQQTGHLVRNRGGLLRTFLEEELSGTPGGMASSLGNSLRAPYGESRQASERRVREQARLIKEGKL